MLAGVAFYLGDDLQRGIVQRVVFCLGDNLCRGFYRELLFVGTAAGRLSFAPAVFSSPSGRGINGIDERKDFGYVGEIPVIHRYPLLYVLLLYPFIAVKIFDSVLIKI